MFGIVYVCDVFDDGGDGNDNGGDGIDVGSTVCDCNGISNVGVVLLLILIKFSNGVDFDG